MTKRNAIGDHFLASLVLKLASVSDNAKELQDGNDSKTDDGLDGQEEEVQVEVAPRDDVLVGGGHQDGR